MMMRIVKLTTVLFGLFIFFTGFNVAFADTIQVSTGFTCSTNAECKRKCEALGKGHVWKPNPGGSTHGTCTKIGRGYKELTSKHKQKQVDKKQVNKGTTNYTAESAKPLSILECKALGGKVQYHAGCSTTLLKCSNNGYADCITKTPLTKKK